MASEEIGHPPRPMRPCPCGGTVTEIPPGDPPRWADLAQCDACGCATLTPLPYPEALEVAIGALFDLPVKP